VALKGQQEHNKLPNCKRGTTQPYYRVSNSSYGHQISAYILLKTNKNSVPKTNEAVCIVGRLYAPCLLRKGVYQKGDASALLTVTDIQNAFPNGLVNGQSEEVTG
jgi:hypothetical protein